VNLKFLSLVLKLPITYIAVYVYVYLTGQTVNQNSGGTIINWNPT